MDKFDTAIRSGVFPPEPKAGTQPADPGCSYYWDRRREGLDHTQAVRRAAKDMGVVLTSLRSVQKYAR